MKRIVIILSKSLFLTLLICAQSYAITTSFFSTRFYWGFGVGLSDVKLEKESLIKLFDLGPGGENATILDPYLDFTPGDCMGDFAEVCLVNKITENPDSNRFGARLFVGMNFLRFFSLEMGVMNLGGADLIEKTNSLAILDNETTPIDPYDEVKNVDISADIEFWGMDLLAKAQVVIYKVYLFAGTGVAFIHAASRAQFNISLVDNSGGENTTTKDVVVVDEEKTGGELFPDIMVGGGIRLSDSVFLTVTFQDIMHKFTNNDEDPFEAVVNEDKMMVTVGLTMLLGGSHRACGEFLC